MIRLLSVIVFLSLLVTGYIYSTRSTEANVVILSPSEPCEMMKYDAELYETCQLVMEFERTSADVQIIID